VSTNWWAVLAAAIVSYAIGSLSPADYVAKHRGVDLHKSGSGNPGATNVGRLMGRRVGIVVGIVDAIKGFIPTWYFFQFGDPAGQVAGLAAVLGHITSPLLHGRGGKGVATSLGAILGVHWPWAVPVVLAFLVAYKVTHKVGVGSVVGSLLLVPVSLVWFQNWWDVAFAAGLAVLVLWRHRKNIDAFRRERMARRAGTQLG
jgi:glycerol-3-phosphate acyltransferase PlsY